LRSGLSAIFSFVKVFLLAADAERHATAKEINVSGHATVGKAVVIDHVHRDANILYVMHL
jgi:hypothetical protein